MRFIPKFVRLQVEIFSSFDCALYSSFIKYYCEEDSLRAIEETNGMLFEGGKPISVKKAVKRYLH